MAFSPSVARWDRGRPERREFVVRRFAWTRTIQKRRPAAGLDVGAFVFGEGESGILVF